MPLVVEQTKIRPQAAHDLHELWQSLLSHPQAEVAEFFCDMTRGMNQALNVLEEMVERGYDRIDWNLIWRICRVVEDQRDNATLKFKYDQLDLAFIYTFNCERHVSTRNARMLGRRAALIYLRMRAENETFGGKFNLAANIREIREAVQLDVMHTMPWRIALVNHAMLRRAFDEGM